MAVLKFPFDELQLAMYDRLTTDITTTDIVDYPSDPQEQVYPFILVGDFGAEEQSLKGSRGWIVSAEVHVYSDGYGMKEVNDLMAEVGESLTTTALTGLTDFENPLELNLEAEVTREFDGVRHLRHGVVRVIYKVYQS